MADETNDQTNKAGDDNVDLSSLSSFSLGPDWVSGNKTKSRLPKEAFNDDGPPRRGPNKDRRGHMARKRPRFDRDNRGPRRDQSERSDRFEKREPFKPILAVDFYPEEEPFKVLSQAIKTSCRTFELFEIARLILEKPERFVCVARDPDHKEGEPANLWACVPDGLPFQSEEEAMTHTFRHYMSDFFNMETVEVDPPAGSFQMVHKCGMTGDLLAPPNYHRYQAICREHHAAKLSHVPYQRFEQRLESSREEEDIQAWITSMKTRTRYILKEDPEQTFDAMEDARLYLVTQAKDKLVRPAYSARFSGKSLALLNPGNPIRRSVEYLLEGQKRFPLDTANHLRGRLRRMHFAVYKRGSKGVSFVCAVKRHFRKPDEVLADNLQKLIEFIESKPNFPAKDLPKAFLDADPETDLDAIKKLKTDLHYLVSQGYVIEYSDGRLFVPPIREDEIRHMEKLKAKVEAEKTSPEASPVAAADPVVPADKETQKTEEAEPSSQALAEAQSDSAESAETVVDEQPVEPVEPEKPADAPAETTAEEPVAADTPPVEEKADATDAASPVDAEPSEAVEAVEPSLPEKAPEPEVAADPEEPEEAAEPKTVAEPEEAAEAEEPVEPVEPTKPEEPAADVQVEEAEKADDSDTDTDSDTDADGDAGEDVIKKPAD